MTLGGLVGQGGKGRNPAANSTRRVQCQDGMSITITRGRNQTYASRQFRGRRPLLQKEACGPNYLVAITCNCGINKRGNINARTNCWHVYLTSHLV